VVCAPVFGHNPIVCVRERKILCVCLCASASTCVCLHVRAFMCLFVLFSVKGMRSCVFGIFQRSISLCIWASVVCVCVCIYIHTWTIRKPQTYV